jgi:serine/threonine protein kinase
MLVYFNFPSIAHLEHPHIVRVLEFGVEDTTPYLIMSYAPGGTLRTRHPKGTVLPVALVVSYVEQVMTALAKGPRQRFDHIQAMASAFLRTAVLGVRQIDTLLELENVALLFAVTHR